MNFTSSLRQQLLPYRYTCATDLFAGFALCLARSAWNCGTDAETKSNVVALWIEPQPRSQEIALGTRLVEAACAPLKCAGGNPYKDASGVCL